MKKYETKYPITYLPDLSMPEARKMMKKVINARHEPISIPVRWILRAIGAAIALAMVLVSYLT